MSRAVWWWSFRAALVIAFIIAVVIVHYHRSFDRDVHLVPNREVGYTAVIQVPDDFWAMGSSVPVLDWDCSTDMDLYDGIRHWVWTERVVDIRLSYIRLVDGDIPEQASHLWRYSTLDGKPLPEFINRVVLMRNGLAIANIPLPGTFNPKTISLPDTLTERIERRFQFRSRRFSAKMEGLR
jgi:hypothetical protein